MPPPSIRAFGAGPPGASAQGGRLSGVPPPRTDSFHRAIIKSLNKDHIGQISSTAPHIIVQSRIRKRWGRMLRHPASDSGVNPQ